MTQIVNVIKNKKMNSKFYVSLEAARLLKEKGYNEQCDYCFYYDDYHDKWDFDSPYNLFDDDPMYYNNETIDDEMYSMPTKAEVIDWLESKGMCIIVFRRTIDNKVEWRYVIHGHTEIISGFQTRLEAKDAAIIKACKLLENGN